MSWIQLGSSRDTKNMTKDSKAKARVDIETVETLGGPSSLCECSALLQGGGFFVKLGKSGQQKKMSQQQKRLKPSQG
jgi:hypothetical protein